MTTLKAQYLYVSYFHAMINQSPSLDSSGNMCNELAGVDMVALDLSIFYLSHEFKVS